MQIHPFHSFKFQNTDIKLFYNEETLNSPSITNEKIIIIFNDINNCNEAELITTQLDCSGWDLNPYKYTTTTLKELIYIKFIDSLSEYFEKNNNNLTQDQKKIVADFLNSCFLLNKLPSFSKEFKSADNYLSFLWIEKLCKTSPLMLTLTIDQIFQKTYSTIDPLQTTALTPNTMQNAFIITELFFCDLIGKLEILNKNQTDYLNEFVEQSKKNIPGKKHAGKHGYVINTTPKKELEENPQLAEVKRFQKILKNLTLLHKTQSEKILEGLKGWISLVNEPHKSFYQAISLKKDLLFYESYIIDKIDILKGLINIYQNEIKVLLPIEEDDSTPLFLTKDIKEILKTDSDNSQFMEEILFLNNLNDQLKSLTESANNLINSVKNSGKRTVQNMIKDKTSNNNLILVQNKAKNISKLFTEILTRLDQYKNIITGYTKIATDYFESILLNLPKNQKIGDLADTRNWIDMSEEWLQPSKKIESKNNSPEKKIKKNSKIKTNLIETTPSIAKKFQENIQIIEKKKNKISPQKEIRQSLLKITSLLNKESITELDLKDLNLIHKLHNLLEPFINPSISNSNNSNDKELLILKECQSHLFLWGCDLNLLIQALSKNDFESLASIVPMLFLNIHTLFEQLMQQKHVVQHGKIYTDSHRLTDLAKKINTEKEWDSLTLEFIKKIDAASLWTRYIKYYENQYSEESERSTLLNSIIYCVNFAENIQKESLELDKKKIKELNEKVVNLFEIVQMAYKCFFLSFDESKENVIGDKTVTAWYTFLDKAQLSIIKHLNKQEGSTITKKELSSLSTHEKSLSIVLESIDKKIADFSSTKLLEFNNPRLQIEEAKQQIIRLLTNIRMVSNYPSPIFTATFFRNYLGVQWIVEQLLNARCIFNKIPLQLTHNFRVLQNLLISNESITLANSISNEVKITVEKENTNSHYFNCNIGFNYPHMYTNGDLTSLKELKNLLTIAKQYFDMDEEELSNRPKLDEELLRTIEKKAIKVIVEQVNRTFYELASGTNN
jgi:hypothetical protein